MTFPTNSIPKFLNQVWDGLLEKKTAIEGAACTLIQWQFSCDTHLGKRPPLVSTLVGNWYFFVNWPANVLLSRPHTKTRFVGFVLKNSPLVLTSSFYRVSHVIYSKLNWLCKNEGKIFMVFYDTLNVQY